jgi:predicted dehydrogenase
MVIGSEGTIFASSTTEALVERWNAQRASFEPLPPAGADGGLAAEIAHFAHAVLNDGEPDIELDWSIRVLEACLALEKSFREGRRLQLTQPA